MSYNMKDYLSYCFLVTQRYLLRISFYTPFIREHKIITRAYRTKEKKKLPSKYIQSHTRRMIHITYVSRFRNGRK